MEYRVYPSSPPPPLYYIGPASLVTGFLLSLIIPPSLMATEFPPNLDDGELWLPSDIIPEVGSLRPVFSGPGDVEALAKQLAAIGYLDPYPARKRPAPAVNLAPDLAEGFWPATGSVLGYEGYLLTAGTGAYLQGFSAVRQYKTSTPVQAQMADAFGPGRQRRRPQHPNAGPAPFYPYRANGSSRACAGTGVFLPRVVNNEAVKRKPVSSMKDGEQQQQKQQQQAAMKKRVGGKQMQVMPLIQPPPEISLPQEWTY